MPAFTLGEELTGWQAVQPLIREEDKGRIAKRVEAAEKVRVEGRQRICLPRSMDGARLIHRQRERFAAARGADGAHHVGHHRATPAADFDKPRRGRAAHGLPLIQRPEAEQFTKDLADFRGSNEIPADTGPGRVIAVPGIMQAGIHISRDRQRPARLNKGLQLVLEAQAETCTGGLRSAFQTRKAPPIHIGSDRSWPMVSQSGITPQVKLSGSRNCSEIDRPTP